MMKNKDKYMTENEKILEKEAISILNKNIKKSEKAKELGYKRMSVYVDGKRTMGYVRGHKLFTSLKSLITSHKKYPLGFDFYYWSNECYLLKKQISN